MPLLLLNHQDHNVRLISDSPSTLIHSILNCQTYSVFQQLLCFSLSHYQSDTTGFNLGLRLSIAKLQAGTLYFASFVDQWFVTLPF